MSSDFWAEVCGLLSSSLGLSQVTLLGPGVAAWGVLNVGSSADVTCPAT